MSSYFALWRAILHVPFSPLPLQNTIYSLSYVQRTLCHYNVVTLPGDCHATLAMTNSALHGILQCECSDYVFTTQLFLSRTKYLMSLRGATRRGNLPEGTPCKKLRGNDREARKNRRKATVFVMPTDNNTNLGFTPCFWLILRYAHGLYGKVLSRSRALSYSKNMTENLFTTENAEISDDFWKRRTQLYCMYYKRAFFIKALKYRRFGNVRIIICWHRLTESEKMLYHK